MLFKCLSLLDWRLPDTGERERERVQISISKLNMKEIKLMLAETFVATPIPIPSLDLLLQEMMNLHA